MMDGISHFSLSIGIIAGAISEKSNEVTTYMLERGIPQEEIDAYFKATTKIARAFYRKPGDKDREENQTGKGRD